MGRHQVYSMAWQFNKVLYWSKMPLQVTAVDTALLVDTYLIAPSSPCGKVAKMELAKGNRRIGKQ